MSLMRRGFLAMSVASLFFATQAFAGGNGGTKKNATIKVTNESTQTVGVYYDSTNSKIQSAFSDTTSAQALADFQAGGGVILAPNATTTFSVKAGAYTFVAFDENQVNAAFTAGDTSVPAGLIATDGIIATAGQTKKVFIINSNSNPPPTGTGTYNTTTTDISILDP